jgi:hypothetical protein
MGGRGTNRDFDGNAGVDAVLVVEIDAIQVEALQVGLTGGSHIRRIATDILNLPIDIPKPELGCQFHPLFHASILQSLLPKKRNLAKNKRTSKQKKKRKRKKEMGTFPRRISLVKGPYMSEVSRKVTPEWAAWWMRAIMSCSGLGGP